MSKSVLYNKQILLQYKSLSLFYINVYKIKPEINQSGKQKQVSSKASSYVIFQH